jgi:ABC-type phosphate transport system substrate-binding protein
VRSDNAISIVAPPKTNPRAYPICTFTWVIAAKKSKKASDLKKFIGWAITKGQSYGPKLDFVPIPKIVLAADQKTLAKVHS